MAGDWIKMKTSLPKDPRIVRMASALKADRLRTVGGCLSAWCLADELTEDGHLDGYTPDLLDELVGLPGLARAMESVGWLIITPEALEFPRFHEHNGKSAKRRAQDSVRKMSARQADKTRTREEKSRSTSLKRGKPPTADDLIALIPSDWSPIATDAATAWARDKQARPIAKHRFGSSAAWEANLKRMALYPAAILRDAVDRAIASGWQGWEHDSISKISPPKAYKPTTGRQPAETIVVP